MGDLQSPNDSSITVTSGSSSSPLDLKLLQCVTLKLSSSNYLIWKTQVESWLNSHRLLGYVTGASPRPQPTMTVKQGELTTEIQNPAYLQWVCTDQMILASLFGSMTEDALRTVYGLHTSFEVWLALAKTYNRVSPSRKSDLQRRLQTVSKTGKSMEAYLNSVKLICDQLDSIGFPVPDNDKIYGALHGLGPEYESITTVIENSLDTSSAPTFDDVVIKLTNFEDRLQTYQTVPTVTPHLAFATGRGQGYNTTRGGNFSGRGRGSYSTRGRGFYQQINSGSVTGDGNRPTCQICHKYGHSADRCYNRFDHAYQSSEQLSRAFAAMNVSRPPTHAPFMHSPPHMQLPQANYAYSQVPSSFSHPQAPPFLPISAQASPGTEWYPDTGATAHITNSTGPLQKSQVYEGHDAVIVGSGDFLPITHIGSGVLPGVQGQENTTAPHQRKQT